jgi:hypothetical protein
MSSKNVLDLYQLIALRFAGLGALSTKVIKVLRRTRGYFLIPPFSPCSPRCHKVPVNKKALLNKTTFTAPGFDRTHLLFDPPIPYSLSHRQVAATTQPENVTIFQQSTYSLTPAHRPVDLSTYLLHRSTSTPVPARALQQPASSRQQ